MADKSLKFYFLMKLPLLKPRGTQVTVFSIRYFIPQATCVFACCLECVAYVLLLRGFKKAFPAFKTHKKIQRA